MAFLTVNSNTPLDLHTPLISFKVRGEEVAAILPNGVIEVAGVGFPDKSYLQSAVQGTTDILEGGSFDPFDGGQF